LGFLLQLKMLESVLSSVELGDQSSLALLWNNQVEDLLGSNPQALADLLQRASRNPYCLAWILEKLTLRKIDLLPSIQLWNKLISEMTITRSQESADTLVERVEHALNVFKKGDFLVVFDSKDRENEGDLIIAAEFCTPEKVAFMVRHTSGLICVPILASRLKELEIPIMVPEKDHSEYHGTAFTVSVDFKHGTTTGISASDRSKTIMALAQPEKYKKDDFVRPGHIFPLRSRDGGILVRPGHTEASTDLCKLAGLYPAAAICEITKA
jgi:3,4-dihydroxy-2-butanone 4-phosphate synthase